MTHRSRTARALIVGSTLVALTACGDDGVAVSDSTAGERVPVSTSASPTDDAATIGIVNFAPIDALLMVEEGFTEAMAECAVAVEYDSRDAGGDPAALGPIVEGFLDREVDLILAISTPAVQAAVATNEASGSETPVLFGAVTDPYEAGVAAGPNDKPSWLTGWQADAPVTGMFDIAAEIVADLDTIGVVYEPSQVNAVHALTKMQAEAEARGGIAIETVTIGDASEVGDAAQDLADRGIDVFFVPTDIIVVDGLDGMLTVADELDIPVIAQDPHSTVAGAAIGTGLDYRGDGGRLAEQACQILRGEATPADFPIEQFGGELVTVNSASAAAQGLEIPDHLLERAVDNA